MFSSLGTEGLFRAGIMNSGGPPPTGDITGLQSTYDFVVGQVGCSSASDTLACLREVPVDDILAAANQTSNAFSYAGLNVPYITRADGIFLSEPPRKLSLAGKFAKVPFIIGDVKDEGTIFSIGSTNVTYVGSL